MPEVDGGKSVKVVGVDGAALDLQAQASCGGGESLLRYDAEANRSTVLLDCAARRSRFAAIDR